MDKKDSDRKDLEKEDLERRNLKTALVHFLGEEFCLKDEISSASSMEELLELWEKSPRGSEVEGLVLARIKQFINELPGEIDKLPGWFKEVLEEKLVLPVAVRDLFKEKALKIYLQLQTKKDTL